MRLSLCAWKSSTLVRLRATNVMILSFSLLAFLSSNVYAQGSGVGNDPIQRVSATDLVRRALASNTELAAARLQIERARARRRQSELRPNPALDFEQASGVDSPGERATSIGLSLPIELGSKRQRRIDLAQAELTATEAEVADRERRLANEVRASYAEVLAAERELSITVELNNVDVQTAQVVKNRVDEGDAAPLELNLLRVEIERLRSRRALVEGRLAAALLKLKQFAGISPTDALVLSEELLVPKLPEPPATIELAIEQALNSRPDLKLARLTEEIARAGYGLARAQALPDVTAFTRYAIVQSTFDQTPIGRLTDRDHLFIYGISINLPFFNRNQGAKAEAEIAITQAQRRREFIDAVVRSEVRSAWQRYDAASIAVQTFEQSVIPRSNENISAIRGAYQVGAFRVTELLTEQRRLIEAQREYTEALTERYRAIADLQAAIGFTINQ